MSTSTEPIVVIGAGILGLSSATLLQSQYPKAPITIVAAEFPGTKHPSVDYASAWAGAHYRPIPRSTTQLHNEAQLAIRTAEIMKNISTDSPEAGVAIMQGIEYLEKPGDDVSTLKTGDIYAGPDDKFRILDGSELPPGVKWGCEYQTYCVNVDIYCRWLIDRFVAKGGELLQHRLSTAAEAFEVAQKKRLGAVRLVVNCSGRNFDQDPKTTIIRGQTVLVRQQYQKTITRQNSDGSWIFVIPRPCEGGTIVGGTKEVGDKEDQAKPEIRRALLRKCVDAFPDFVDSVDQFEVVKDNVGRRPWREGGVRVELESSGHDRKIVHGYGAGGRGYELSWGVAENILDLVKFNLPARSRL